MGFAVAEYVEGGVPYEHDEQRAGRLALQASLVGPAGHRNIVAVEPESPRPVGAAGPGGNRDGIPDPGLQVGDSVQACVQTWVRRRGPSDITVIRGEQPPAQRKLRRVQILAAQRATGSPSLRSDEDREPGQGHADSHSTSVVRRETVRFTDSPTRVANP